MITTGALVVVAPVSTGVAPASATHPAGPARPIPIRSVTAPAPPSFGDVMSLPGAASGRT